MSEFNQLFDNNPNKEAIKFALIGSREHIEMMILMLHSKDIVEAGEWCRLQPTGQPQEFITLVGRNLK